VTINPLCPAARQVYSLPWSRFFSDPDGDAFSILPGGSPTGLAINGVLDTGDANNRLITFVPNLGTPTGSFNIFANDGRAGGASSLFPIALTFSERQGRARGRGGLEARQNASAAALTR
jgi:hypothetical protein